jgi:hypothetical protein
MQARFSLRSLVIVAASLAVTSMASAQGVSGGPGVGVGPAAPAPSTGTAGITSSPGPSSTSATGTGAGATTGMSTGSNVQGVPNTSTPGRIGTGASPSGLPGDDPAHPGYPAKLGQ